MAGKKKSNGLTGSTLAKSVAFFVLAISIMLAGIGAIGTVALSELGRYDYESGVYATQELATLMMREHAVDTFLEMHNHYFRRSADRDPDYIEKMCRYKNYTVEIYEDEELIWSNYEGKETPYYFHYYFDEWVEEPISVEDIADESKTEKETADADSETVNEVPETIRVQKMFEYRLYVNTNMVFPDEYRTSYDRAVVLCELTYVFPAVAVGGIFLFLICFVFLMCSAGHRKGREEIFPGVLTAIHFDVLTVGFGIVAVFWMMLLRGILGQGFRDLVTMGIFIVMCTVLAVLGTIYCMEFALRLKLGGLWKNTLVYIILRWILRICRFWWKALVTLIKGFPLVINVAIIFLGICILEFCGLCIWCHSGELVVVWFLEKLILCPIVLYFSLVCKKLQEGSKALAEGNLNFQLDTSKMILAFKEHGENLNKIGQGIAKAVEERMRSEHLKTELITNVSHDLKTPLTSIINYSDLIAQEVLKQDNETKKETESFDRQEGIESSNKIAQYAEVLLRQSKRLKKLLEDLVEASKATTGNLEVNLESCEINVLLSQAVGEYEQRFMEKQLELIIRQPQESVRIMADGRHLWRVFDNLLNNVCKYAQENTRVYLNVEQKEEQVSIIFRNMSKYALEVSGEELEERFVRGDKSRHMEGNGLGLSIAKSLVELQNGHMEIVTDGDLFKVTLFFPRE